jgi:hypothetical protein
MLPTRFEPAIPASERPTHVLGRAATGIGSELPYLLFLKDKIYA